MNKDKRKNHSANKGEDEAKYRILSLTESVGRWELRRMNLREEPFRAATPKQWANFAQSEFAKEGE